MGCGAADPGGRSGLNEYPVFVPHKGEHMGAVVTIPDGDPTGLAIFIGAVGDTRARMFQMWTLAARAIAARGVASIRLEYPGAGDSTSVVEEWSVRRPPLGEVLSAARFGMRSVGVDRVVPVGSCFGGRVALFLAAELDECVGAMCIQPSMLELGTARWLRERSQRSRVLAPIRAIPLARRVARSLASRSGLDPELQAPVEGALGHANLLFVHSPGPDAEVFTERIREALSDHVRQLPPEHRSRYELRYLEGASVADLSSRYTQQVLLDTIVDWVPGVIGSGPQESVEAQESAGLGGA